MGHSNHLSLASGTRMRRAIRIPCERPHRAGTGRFLRVLKGGRSVRIQILVSSIEAPLVDPMRAQCFSERCPGPAGPGSSLEHRDRGSTTSASGRCLSPGSTRATTDCSVFLSQLLLEKLFPEPVTEAFGAFVFSYICREPFSPITWSSKQDNGRE